MSKKTRNLYREKQLFYRLFSGAPAAGNFFFLLDFFRGFFCKFGQNCKITEQTANLQEEL